MPDAIIRQIDAIHCRVEAEYDVIAEMAEYFTFKVPGAQFSPAFKNKFWDGKIRLLNSLTGALPAGLMQEAASFCQEREYEAELVPLTQGYDPVETLEFLMDLGLPFDPHPHQIDAFCRALEQRRALVLSPTASGKSLVVYALGMWYANARGGHGKRKTLVIVPRVGLVNQLCQDFEDYGCPGDFYHKIDSPKAKVELTDSPVVITTWQAIFKLPKTWFQLFDSVIVDEAHEAKAKSITSIMSLMPHVHDRVGLTGSLDGTQTHALTLQGMFGPVFRAATTKELMDKGLISKAEIEIIFMGYNDDERKASKTLDYQGELDFIINSAKRNEFIKNLAVSLDGNTLVLVDRVETHAEPLYEAIKRATNREVFLAVGKVDKDEREIIRKAIIALDESVTVASFGVFQTGINIPNLNNLIIASPYKGRIRGLQSIGRTLRKSEGKTSARIIDTVDDLSWKKRSNYLLDHAKARIETYIEEEFDYKIFRIEL